MYTLYARLAQYGTKKTSASDGSMTRRATELPASCDEDKSSGWASYEGHNEAVWLDAGESNHFERTATGLNTLPWKKQSDESVRSTLATMWCLHHQTWKVPHSLEQLSVFEKALICVPVQVRSFFPADQIKG